jgi:hypothetical protein
MRTRGPIHGHHVSPICLIYVVIKILLESAGFNPQTSLHTMFSHNRSTVILLGCSLVYMYVLKHLNLHIVLDGGGDGSGLSLDPRSHV